MLCILIPTIPKTKEYLDFCVDSLKKNTSIPYEILIGENGQGTEYPQGQCAAVNRLAEEANGDWFLISNDDMYYPLS